MEINPHEFLNDNFDILMKSYISSIATAVPSSPILQEEIASFMAKASDMNKEESQRLIALYRASGISTRYSVIPDFGLIKGDYQFFPNTDNLEPFPTIDQRMRLYEEKALPLCIDAAEKSLRNYEKDKITHVITVSCTGMYAPGLDIELVSSLGLNANVMRTCINYMGCYAAFNAMKAADSFCKSVPNAVVLVVAVELCTIHYQKSNVPDAILSNALFSDGAAAFIVQSDKPKGKSFSIESYYCHLEPGGKDEMAWTISNFGFEMKLTNEVPKFIKNGINELLSNLLDRTHFTTEDIDVFAIHPGGKRILEVIEEELGIKKSKIKYSYDILRNFGNMSSVTILFVLKKIMDEENTDELKNIVSLAFGPGLTMESMLMQLEEVEEISTPESKEPEYHFFA